MKVVQNKVQAYRGKDDLFLYLEGCQVIRRLCGILVTLFRLWTDVNVVFARLQSSISICPYPKLADIVSSIVASTKLSMHSSVY